eukprot:gene8851-10892_t
MARHRIVEIPASNVKKRMTEILYEKGYIMKYKFEDDNKQGLIKIALKYDPQTKEPAIKALERVSRPGLRQYAKPAEIRRVQNGLGIAIVSTSKGLMTDKEAKVQNVGGKKLINLPKGVTLTVSPANEVVVKGPKGELRQMLDRDIK